MKVRVGFGLGTLTRAGEPTAFTGLVDALESHGFDSLWLSERVSADAPEPVVGLAMAAGRTDRLKLGTSVQVLPGRNPALLAAQWATLDRLSGGRALPAFGLGVADPREQALFGVERGQRAAWFDEALPLMRRFWTGEPITHEGERFHYHGVRVGPTPVQQPLDVWLGGAAPSELRRVGRLGDGWLPSFCTPDDVAEGQQAVMESAAEHEREIDPEHWGALVLYTAAGPLPDLLAEVVRRRRPGTAPEAIIPAGLPALRSRLKELIDAGASKFVVVRVPEPESWPTELAELANAVLDLQT